MKLTSSKKRLSRSQRFILIAVTSTVVVAASVGMYLFIRRSNEDALKKSQPSTSAKEDVLNNPDTKTPSVNENLPSDSTSTTEDKVLTDPDLSVSVTDFSQSNGSVSTNAKTSGSGVCVFLFQPSDDGKPVTRQSDVNNSNCSIDIPESEFSYLGDWKLTVTYYKDQKKTETSRNVTIR